MIRKFIFEDNKDVKLGDKEMVDVIIVLSNYGAVTSMKNNLGQVFPENKKYETPFRHLKNWRPSEGLCSVLLQCSMLLPLLFFSICPLLTMAVTGLSLTMTFSKVTFTSAVASTISGA